MRILLVNDDGIGSDGLNALIAALSKKNELLVVAPAKEKSGASTSFTYYKPVSVERRVLEDFPDIEAYAVGGSPADCTKIGFKLLSKKPIELVVSGINRGANLGTDIAYSGTFGAAMEAAMFGTRAIAVSRKIAPYEMSGNDETATRGEGKSAASNIFSAPKKMKFDFEAEYIAKMVDSLAEGAFSIPRGTVLNVNFPADRDNIKGTLMTHPCVLDYNEFYERVGEDAAGIPLYHLRGKLKGSPNLSEDNGAVSNDYISLCPLRFYESDMSMREGLTAAGFLQDSK